MSFSYGKYVEDLRTLLRNPTKWLGDERSALKEMNELITSVNIAYIGLTHLGKDAGLAAQKAVDAAHPGCSGVTPSIKNSNDADRLLFAVFGPTHPMNPGMSLQKMIDLKACLDKKLVAIQAVMPAGTIPAPAPGTATGTAKEKYLKYKNKYLKLKNSF